MPILLVLVLAALLAAGTYLGLERLGRRALLPASLRFVAWVALGTLLVNMACPTPPERRRPMVLLDASLSMASAQWAASRASADSMGEVRYVGDDRPNPDTVANRGRSLVSSALVAAAASDRPVWLVTDGEIEDRGDIPSDVLARAGVKLIPRNQGNDIAVTEVQGADRLTRGDSLRLDVALRATGSRTGDSVLVELRSDVAGAGVLASRRLRLVGGVGRVTLRTSTQALAPGEHLLRVSVLNPQDDEPRTDLRLHRVLIAATPGAVLVASPADWDARFLFRTIREVSDLPLRGYVELAPGDWRSMRDLSRVNEGVVRDAARRADLLVAKGSAVRLAEGSRARGIWRWPTAGGGSEVADWYLVPVPESPLAAALAGLPLDSFPPVAQLTRLDPAPGDWVAFTAQAGRRGAPRAALFGKTSGRTREVTSGTGGLWRWRFRGGSSEQGYRALVAATVSWLLAAPDSATGLARPVRNVVQQGRPLVFQWTGAGSSRPVALSLGSGDDTRADTLRFDGAGRAALWLAPGEYRYRLEDGVTSLAGVETYSDEFLPRPVVLSAQEPGQVTDSGKTSPRDWPWLFAIAVAALCAEWLVRRRMGLR